MTMSRFASATVRLADWGDASALESLLRDKDEVLLLDEPDNCLDVPGKIWLEQQLAAAPKAVLRLGARVAAGIFAPTRARPDLEGRSLLEILMTEHALVANAAMAALARYELQTGARQPFGTLSEGTAGETADSAARAGRFHSSPAG